MKTTYSKLFEFINTGTAYLKSDTKTLKAKVNPSDPDEYVKAEKTPLGYAINKVLSMNKKAQQRYGDKVQDIRTKFAATDANKVLLFDERGDFRFESEKLIECNKEIRELVESEIEVHVYPATGDLPELSFEQEEAFAGFVIEQKEE